LPPFLALKLDGPPGILIAPLEPVPPVAPFDGADSPTFPPPPPVADINELKEVVPPEFPAVPTPGPGVEGTAAPPDPIVTGYGVEAVTGYIPCA